MDKIYTFILKVSDFDIEKSFIYLQELDKYKDRNIISHPQKLFSQLIRYLVFKRFFSISNIKFNQLESGKPNLVNSKLDFSISHTTKFLIMSVSERKVGVDIEHIRDRKNIEKIAERFFRDEEYSQLKKSENFIKDFFMLWTLKEAEVKRSGLGIAKGFNEAAFKKDIDNKWISCNFEQDFFTFNYEDIIGSICCENVENLPREFFRINNNFGFEKINIEEVK
ncbi:4'-phosphopantetheinyl transferase family protein [Pseudofrancisella aestuarii]|uniref:4'-phosphopantetheinyl transferase family protein n=1 Tax=Pseudofrancisella aestuarii TaxID=2670347 RepID=A0ABV9TB44_9GAMM|nr:4'-phosphopantetheinyl transferase superfamily protein [Pseudofrancisella aestuarii]